jgi:hypothetical protein
MENTYKFLPVSEETHREISILKAQEGGLTFDQMVDKLLMFYQANKED